MEEEKNFVLYNTPQPFYCSPKTGTIKFDSTQAPQPTSIPSTTNFNFKIAQWNCHSLSAAKWKYICSHSAEIILLQEIWDPCASVFLQSPRSIFGTRRTLTQGGGSLMAIDNLVYKCVHSLEINQDFSIYKLILGRDKFVWIGSAYLSTGTPAQLKEL